MNDVATREVLWNISYYYLMYPMFLVALIIAGKGAWKRFKYWSGGKADKSVRGDWLRRITGALLDTFLQRRVVQSIVPGIFHVSIFWSFIILFIATSVVAIDMYLPWKIFHGPFYLGLSLLADLAGGFFTIGLGMAFVRRYVVKPRTIKRETEDAWIHGLFFFLMFSGFILEGIRIRYTNDPWAAWTPFGGVAAAGFTYLSEGVGRFIHVSLWWIHAIATFVMIAMIPYTKLSHLFIIPVNLALASNRPRGSLKRIDLEKLLASDSAAEVNLGTTSLADTTWKERLDHDACIECGRCDQHCPANAAGKNLSPMNIILNQRNLSRQAYAQESDGNDHLDLLKKPLVGETIAPISLWECRTCYACVEVCPVGIDQLGQIIEMRRSEVLMKGEMPSEAQAMLRGLETRGNPFGSQEDRLAWIKKEGFRLLKEGEKVDVLYWIGCATSFDPRKQKVARDLVKIMDHAGVNYAVLGEKEYCTGDPARILGDENIFQTKAKEQRTLINPEQFDLMVVNCPHCYNAFDNEYPQFGPPFKVMHHTEFIEKLTREGRLKINSKQSRKITYHDPCYLGRVQGVYDQPRALLTQVAGGAKPIELSRNRERSACCGAGGGHFWMDIKDRGERLDNRRIDEVKATGADTVGVGCIFCMQMLENGLKARNLDDKIKVRDIAELVAESLNN